MDMFASIHHIRTGLEMALANRCGQVHFTKDSAVAIVDPFIYFGGQPNEELMSHVGSSGIVIDPSAEWAESLAAFFPVHRLVERQAFDGGGLEPSKLRGLTRGYDVRRVDLALTARLATEVHEDLIVLPEQFAEDGTGFCAFLDDRIVAGATGAFWTDAELEIQVNTAEGYRNQGYAAAVSAALILECLSRGITPCWDTESSISARLAKRLGYSEAGTYLWMVLG